MSTDASAGCRSPLDDGRHVSQDHDGSRVLARLKSIARTTPEEASFRAAAFLATVGIGTPRCVGTAVQVHTYEEMVAARDQVQKLVYIADERLNSCEGSKLEELHHLESMLTFLEQVCILDECFAGAPVELVLPARDSTYNWEEHVKSLRRIPTALETSGSWTSLSLEETWSESLRETSTISTASFNMRPDRIEWLKDSHQAMIPCRSRHVEKGSDRSTLEKTVRERHSKGLRTHCVRPDMEDMWDAYCNLVWKDTGLELPLTSR